MTDYKKLNLIATSSPHIRGSETTRSIMLDVIIAMLPALVFACFNFGIRALTLTAVSVIGCVGFEWLYRFLMKKPQSVGDLSAVVTGMLLAMTCPVTLDYWAILIGDFFAIIFVKQLFGGIGKNFINPALGGRAALVASYAGSMTKWIDPAANQAALVGSNVDVITAATPMAYLKTGDIEGLKAAYSVSDMLMGWIGKLIGGLDETVVMVAAKLGEAEISKQNVFGEEIVGAELTLTGTDSDGNDIVFALENVIPGQNAELITSEDSTELTWLSGSTPTYVKNLPDGTYVLHEVAAPSGYEVTTDITFTVENGVLSGETGVDSTSVTMMDDMIKTDVTISKQNVFSQEIAGAKLTLTGVDFTGRKVEFSSADVTFGTGAELVSDGRQLTWMSGTTGTNIRNLPDGTYVLHEEAAPSGYLTTTDITFTIENGVVSGEVGVESNSVTMVDDMIKTDVEISKQNVYGKEIAGATLTLTGTDFAGNKVEFTGDALVLGNGAKFVSDGAALTWVSGTTASIVKSLPDGTYVLHEAAAPDGYEVATDITFTIKDGKLEGEAGVESDSVTMMDNMTATDVYISKQDVFSKEIAGATLTLTGIDFEGNKVKFTESGVTFGEGAKFVSDGDALTWLSGTAPTLVRNLPDGTYVLHEIAAPNGYEVATDITFTIENGKLSGEVGVTSTSVTMIDEMIVTTTATTTTTNTTTTTTATEASTTTETTTTSTETTTTEKSTTTKKTTEKKTTAKKTTAKSSDAPKTGDAGTAAPVLVLAMAVTAAFVLRRKRDDEE